MIFAADNQAKRDTGTLQPDAKRRIERSMMNDDLETCVEAVDQAMLTPLVRQALNSKAIEIVDWGTERIYGGSFGIIHRFAGSGRVRDEIGPWSLILKVVRHFGDAPIDRGNPSNTRFWKREPLAYQSGFLADLPGSLVAPRCFGVVERRPDEFWLWLEDVRDEGASTWPLDRYGLAGRHLGQFNGAYLTGQPIPSDSWLGQGLLRAQAIEAAPAIERLPSVLDQPLDKRFFPISVAEGLFQLWGECETFLKVIDRLPQTVCHRDGFRHNLFGRHGEDGREQTVAIDWEDVAVGPVGEDIVSLIVLSLATFEIELEAAQTFEAYVFEGYLNCRIHTIGQSICQKS